MANTTQFILLMKNPSQLLYMVSHSLTPLLASMTGAVVVMMMKKKQDAMSMITPSVTTIV